MLKMTYLQQADKSLLFLSGSNITYNNSGSHALSGVNSENITIKTLTTGGSVTSTGDITCGSIDMSSGTKTFYFGWWEP